MEFVKEIIPKYSPELNEVPFKIESMEVKKRYILRQNKISKSGNKRNPKALQKINPGNIQRIKNQNNIKLITNGTETRSKFWEKFIFNL